MAKQNDLYGLMAEFEDPDALIQAARSARKAGYRRMDAYSPYPVEELYDVLAFRPSILPFLVLGGGLTGALLAYATQYYATVIDYPINVGGRPLHSWPSYIPITFELAILFAAFGAVIGMFVLNGLPQPYHPVFNVPSFELASQNRFFLAIEARDRSFDLEKTRRFLAELNPVGIHEVPK